MAVSFIGEGNKSTRRKPQIMNLSQDNIVESGVKLHNPNPWTSAQSRKKNIVRCIFVIACIDAPTILEIYLNILAYQPFSVYDILYLWNVPLQNIEIC